MVTGKNYGSFSEAKPVNILVKNPKPQERKIAKPNDLEDINFSWLVPSGLSTSQKRLNPYGPYHINHFIAYFDVTEKNYTADSGKATAGQLTWLFFRNFCEIFSIKNIALAQFGVDNFSYFHDRKTVEFTIGGNKGGLDHKAIGFFHPDWVAMSCFPSFSPTVIESDAIKEINCFSGDTLRRKWFTDVEKKIVLPAIILTDLFAKTPVSLAIKLIAEYFLLLDKFTLADVLRSHFLAGTRSWRVGFDTKVNAFYVETIAVERYSSIHYAYVDKIHSTRDDVLLLWDSLISNFLNTHELSGFRFEPRSVTNDYADYEKSKTHEHVCHKTWEFESGQALLNFYKDIKTSPAIRTIVLNHPSLFFHFKNLKTLREL